MSVDKFGRHSRRKAGCKKGPKGEGYKLTPEGDYDIQNKRMRYVEDPVENGDAVNLKTLSSGLVNCVQLTPDKRYFDAQYKRIGNAVDPIEQGDLVTKGYLENKVPIQNQALKSYSVHHYSIKDVAHPIDSNDAVNLNYMKSNCLMKSDSQVFDGAGGIIANLRDPKKGSDAATKLYVDVKTPVQYPNSWAFGNKRLTNIGDPVDKHNATTVDYVQKNALCLSSTELYDVKQKLLSNLALPIDLDDAVSKRYLKKVLSDFAYEVYTNLNRGRTSVVPETEWKAKVFETEWKELFKLN